MSEARSTYTSHLSPGLGYFVAEWRAEGFVFASTKRNVRIVSGPYTSSEQAAEHARQLGIGA